MLKIILVWKDEAPQVLSLLLQRQPPGTKGPDMAGTVNGMSNDDNGN